MKLVAYVCVVQVLMLSSELSFANRIRHRRDIRRRINRSPERVLLMNLETPRRTSGRIGGFHDFQWAHRRIGIGIPRLGGNNGKVILMVTKFYAQHFKTAGEERNIWWGVVFHSWQNPARNIIRYFTENGNPTRAELWNHIDVAVNPDSILFSPDWRRFDPDAAALQADYARMFPGQNKKFRHMGALDDNVEHQKELFLALKRNRDDNMYSEYALRYLFYASDMLGIPNAFERFVVGNARDNLLPH